MRVTKNHPVPMWKTEYLTQNWSSLKDVIVRMVDPSETLWAAEETTVSRGGDDFVLVLSVGGVGWMVAEHLGVRS